MAEVFKAKSKNYKHGLDPGKERFVQGGKILEKPVLTAQFRNFTYTAKQEGSLSEKQVSKILHASDRYNIDFISVANEEVKKEMGDFKKPKNLEPCPYCGLKTFKTKGARQSHIVACEKKFVAQSHPIDPRVKVERLADTDPEEVTTDGADTKTG